MNIFLFVAVLLLAYLPYKGRSFTALSGHYAVVLFFWFILWSVALCYFVFPLSIIKVNYFTMVTFIVSMSLWFVSPFMVRRFGEAPAVYIKENPIRFLVRFEFSTMLVKLGEIVFQQAGFLYMLFFLLNETSNELMWFTGIIALLHLWNVFVMPVRLALFYFALSIPMAVIFGILIQHGYIFLATSIHLLFYLIFNGSYWFIKSKRTLI